MEHICEEGMCSGCMACQAVCPQFAATVHPGVQCYQPLIDRELCIDCGKCVAVCQQRNPAPMREPRIWKQGWVSDSSERAASSSGGIASAIIRGFIGAGGVVVACRFSNGEFGFERVKDIADLDRFKGSKYVKSDPLKAYELVDSALGDGRRVLFVGLPCQVAAMRNYVGCVRDGLLYTVDLICHGSPSPQVLELFLQEHGVQLAELSSIDFRWKTRFGLRGGFRAFDVPGVLDRYTIGFLEGLTYTDNCYACPYATTARVSDLTLGDSWGSDLSDEVSSGISLVICITEKGEELLHMSNAELCDVDILNAIANNAQLSAPSVKPKTRDKFVGNCSAGMAFSRNIAHCLPRQCFRQHVKRMLVKMGLWKSGGGSMNYGLSAMFSES